VKICGIASLWLFLTYKGKTVKKGRRKASLKITSLRRILFFIAEIGGYQAQNSVSTDDRRSI
jgi:hypothetical protein